MKILSDEISPFVLLDNLMLRPDVHNDYPVTVFKINETVSAELIDGKFNVSTYTVTECWNASLIESPSEITVNDQIIDSVTAEPLVVNDAVTVDEKISVNKSPLK